MIYRCYNTEDKSYRYYGKKGIKIYQDWLDNPLSFETWAYQNGYKDSLTIDRINSGGNYEPLNCRWVSSNRNAKYKSNTNYITVFGITNSGRGWSKMLGLPINRINKIKRKYGLEYTMQYIKDQLHIDKNGLAS